MTKATNLPPDFEALRAERNAAMDAYATKMRAEGFEVGPCSMRDKDACYCACGTGGPCEHTWDGKWWESEGGRAFSATCSRCGMPAMSHSMRVG